MGFGSPLARHGPGPLSLVLGCWLIKAGSAPLDALAGGASVNLDGASPLPLCFLQVTTQQYSILAIWWIHPKVVIHIGQEMIVITTRC
jgi:hypothetical protein